MLRGGRLRGAATWRRAVVGAPRNANLITGHPDCAPVLLEEDAAPVADLLLVRLISEGLEIVVGLLVCEEEEQLQEFTLDAAEVHV